MIDQMKIGSFLKELRKEKEMTQEQLAEKFGVSSRSVSRWENGNTMPELGILVELAEYYEVDIKEIIDGERKSESMNKEEKETLRKVADYTEAEKQLVVRRKCIVTFVGTMAFALCIMIGYLVFPTLPEDSFLRSDGLWLGIGILGLAVLWGTIIHENRKNAK
jgi:transcriptional regulator with XRE-family HTH domain